MFIELCCMFDMIFAATKNSARMCPWRPENIANYCQALQPTCIVADSHKHTRKNTNVPNQTTPFTSNQWKIIWIEVNSYHIFLRKFMKLDNLRTFENYQTILLLSAGNISFGIHRLMASDDKPTEFNNNTSDKPANAFSPWEQDDHRKSPAKDDNKATTGNLTNFFAKWLHCRFFCQFNIQGIDCFYAPDRAFGKCIFNQLSGDEDDDEDEVLDVEETDEIKLETKTNRPKQPSIFSVTSLLSDDKKDQTPKEESNIATRPFFYPGKTLITRSFSKWRK